MPRNYVDNDMNRRLGRVGLPHGTAVHHSSSSSDYGCSSMSSGSQRTYVDNSMNRQLGRVGLEHGTAVHSKSSAKANIDTFENHFLGFQTPSRQSSLDYSSCTSSGSHKTYVDNPMNRQLGRVGLEHGTAVHSNSSTSSGSHKTHMDNPLNRQLGPVGLEHGTAVHSNTSTSSGSHKTYVDNALNRQLGRVGLKHGTAVHSKDSCQNISGVSSTHRSVVDKEVKKSLNTFNQGTSNLTPEKKVYVDNAYNRKLGRVGLPLGSAPDSKKNVVYKDTLFNIKQGRAGKPLGTHSVGKKKLASMSKHLEEHFDEEIPAELNDVSEDAVSYVLEFMQRIKETKLLLEERGSILWKPDNQSVNQEYANSAEKPFQQESARHTGQALMEMVKKIECKEIDFEKLQMGKRIGHGGFGEVFIATLDNIVVAVKKLKNQQVSKRRLQQFMNEMAVLQKLDHPNIISFYGVCTVIPNLAFVMEFMDMSLFDSIQIKEVDLTDDDKLEIMLGVTNGMAYLHQQDIAHCDLKSKNVLLANVPGLPQTDENEPVSAKITDFGLSKMKSDTVTTTSCPSVNIGTPLYAAPEILRGEILTLDELKKADMYSLGLLIWELVLEEIPFEDLSYEQLKVQVGIKGLKPIMSEDLRLDRKLHEILCLCWSMDPNKRPSAKKMMEVATTLTTLFEGGEE